jgi:hypothetical protein
MATSDSETPQPVRVVRVSPTEMAGDWVAEVQKKLIDQGLDPQVAAQIARVGQAELQQLAGKTKTSRPSWWRRILSYLGATSHQSPSS